MDIAERIKEKSLKRRETTRKRKTRKSSCVLSGSENINEGYEKGV